MGFCDVHRYFPIRTSTFAKYSNKDFLKLLIVFLEMRISKIDGIALVLTMNIVSIELNNDDDDVFSFFTYLISNVRIDEDLRAMKSIERAIIKDCFSLSTPRWHFSLNSKEQAE